MQNVSGSDAIFNLREYKAFVNQLRHKIRGARLKATLAINKEMVRLYWDIGKQIIKRNKWGSKLVEFLSRDLQATFPETKGFSVRNLQRMRQFAATYPDFEKMPQSVAQLPWGHISVLIQMVKNDYSRSWYADQSLELGWSRVSLERNVKDGLYQRQAFPSQKASNYLERLCSPQSVVAQELLKQPYHLDFLGLHDDAMEREIEHASIKHIAKFMLELGKGFAFVGSQVPILIDDEQFFMDMLFYNYHLRCFTVVELKATKFKPEHAGQLNFYLSAVDELMRHQDDNPSIGLLLCQSRNKIVAEYALKDMQKPIGISEYQLTRAIPEGLQGDLPSIEEIEAELNEVEDNTILG